MNIGPDFLCPYPCTCKNFQSSKPRCTKECTVKITCTGYEPGEIKIKALEKQGKKVFIPKVINHGSK